MGTGELGEAEKEEAEEEVTAEMKCSDEAEKKVFSSSVFLFSAAATGSLCVCVRACNAMRRLPFSLAGREAREETVEPERVREEKE